MTEEPSRSGGRRATDQPHPMRRAEDRERERVYLRVAVLQMVATLALVLVVFYTAAQGREDLRQSQLRGCERGKLDRSANALGWRTAEHARRASGTPDDIKTANRYARIAGGLELRSRIDCARAFPK